MKRILVRLLPLAAVTCSASDDTSIGVDAAPAPAYEVSFQAERSLADESMGATDVYVRLAPASRERVTVELAVAGGSAVPGEDFSLAAAVATFEPGATLAKISLAIADDAIEEDEEDLELTLRSPQGAVLGERVTHRVRISANRLPRIRFAAPRSTADESAGAQSFELVLDRPSPVDVVVQYAWTGSAEAADHGVSDDQLTIPAGELRRMLPAPITDDPTDEEDETLDLVLSAQAGAVVPPGEGTYVHTIVDDDPPPAVGFACTTSVANEGAGTTLEVSLTHASELQVMVDVAVTGGTTAAGDYSFAAGTLVFDANATILALPIAAAGDAFDEDNETVIVTLSNPVNATLSPTGATHEVLIADDDAPPLLTFQQGASNLVEGVGGTPITVALSAPSGVPVQFSLAASGTAAAGDYSLPAMPYTIPAGTTSFTVNLGLANDTVDEPAETLLLTLANIVNAGVGATVTHTVTITDNDPPPTLAFLQASSEVAEAAGPHVVTVALSATSGFPVQFSLLRSGSASSSDYVLSGSSFTIPAGTTTFSIASTVGHDLLDENDETVSLRLVNQVNAGLGAVVTHVVTIQDNDAPPTLSFQQGASGPSEAAGTHGLTVVLSAPSGRPIQFSMTAGGTAVTPADFSLPPMPIAIPVGATSFTVPVGIVNDPNDESDEKIVLSLANPVNATLAGITVHTVTIADNDTPPTLSFQLTGSMPGEAVGSHGIVVALSATSAFPIQFSLTRSGTSTSSDLTLPASPFTISAGTSSFVVGTLIADDSIDEASETAVLTLTNLVNAAPGSIAVHTVTIQDNDAPPVLAFQQPASMPGEAAGTHGISVALSAVSGLPVQFSLARTGNSTTSDLTLPAGPFTIAAGATTLTISAAVLDDALDEVDETAVLALTGLSNATTGAPATHTVAIADNDAPPVLSFQTPASMVAETAGTHGISVVLSAASGQAVQFSLTRSGSSTTSDLTLAANPFTIPVGATTFTIPATVVNDLLDEASETAVLALASPIHATLGATTAHTVTVTDDDATPTIAFQTAESTAGEAVGTHGISVVLSAPSGRAIQFSLGRSGTSTTSDFTLPSSPFTIAAGATSFTVTATVVNDGLDEADETAVLTLIGLSNVTAGATTAHRVTISDDDAAPTLSFQAAASTAGEAAGTHAIATVLSAASAFPIQFSLTVGGSASAGDFSLPAMPFTIPAGVISYSVPVTIADDAFDEADEPLVLGLANPVNASLAWTTVHTVTITDNDMPPTLSFLQGNSMVAENAGTHGIALVLSAPSASSVQFSLTATGSASSSDLTLPAMPFTIPAGSTSFVVPAAIAGDALDEIDETSTLTLASLVGATAGAMAAHTVAITDDDAPPLVRFDPAFGNSSESEDGLSLGIIAHEVILSAPSGKTVTVGITPSGTATPGIDYALLDDELVFPPGETTRMLVVQVFPDSIVEPNETVRMTLQPAQNATNALDNQLRIHTIVNDDGLCLTPKDCPLPP